MTAHTGHCLCRAVSYRIEKEPLAVLICHCENCRRQNGSIYSVNAIVDRTDYAQQGTTRVFNDRSSDEQPVYRHFCPSCGSPILSALPRLPDQILVKVGTLDAPETLVPTQEFWCDSALPWVPVLPETIKNGQDI